MWSNNKVLYLRNTYRKAYIGLRGKVYDITTSFLAEREKNTLKYLNDLINPPLKCKLIGYADDTVGIICMCITIITLINVKIERTK